MKKFIIFAVALFVLGFAASSFAIQAEIPADTTAAIATGGTQVTIGGELRIRGSIRQNPGDFDRNQALTTSNTTFGKSEHMLYDSRYRLNVEAKVSPNTIGFIQLEAADTGKNTGENSTWGAADSGVAARSYGGTFRLGDQKQNEMRVLQAWIQHSGSGLFGIPAYIKIGHQMITVGAGVFYSHSLQGDDAIVVGINPIKGLDISFTTVKLWEGNTNSADDQDMYSLGINYAINKDVSIGADVSMIQSQNGTSGAPGAWGLSSGALQTKALYSNLYNIGVNAKANIQGFKLYGTADFQTGGDNVPPKWHYRGFALTAGAAYTFAPVTLSLDLGYGSGDSATDNKVGTFLTSQSDVVHYTFVYDYMTANAAGNIAGGLQNTMFVKLGAGADVMKGLNIAGSLTLLNAAKSAFGGGLLTTNAGTSVTHKYIGTEIDTTLTYQIDKGLKYFVEGGYLFAGRFFKDATAGTRGTDRYSDPWAIRHGIQLNF